MSYLLLHLDGFLELGINKNDKFNIMKIRTHSSDLNSTLPSNIVIYLYYSIIPNST